MNFFLIHTTLSQLELFICAHVFASEFELNLIKIMECIGWLNMAVMGNISWPFSDRGCVRNSFIIGMTFFDVKSSIILMAQLKKLSIWQFYFKKQN